MSPDRAQPKAEFEKSAARDAVPKPSYLVPAVDRAVRILLLLKSEGRAMTIAEIADATGWPRPSIHKLLLTLNYHGLLDRDSRTKRYLPGSEFSDLMRLAFASKSLDLRSAAKPFLRSLVEFSGETASLSILRGAQMIFLDVEETPKQPRVSLIVGISTPASTTSNGRAVLAYLPDERVQDIIRMVGLPVTTKRSIFNIDDYQRDLAATRERGYSVDLQEYRQGIVGISAPVFDGSGQVLGALSIVGLSARMTEEKAGQCGRRCVELAKELSSVLRQAQRPNSSTFPQA